MLMSVISRQRFLKEPKVKLKNWTFSYKSSNTTLHNHLDKIHPEEYLKCVHRGLWPNQLPSRDMTIEIHVSPDRVAFSQTEFWIHLVNFIVADDQVRFFRKPIFLLTFVFQSINVVECPEFRKLLLVLREDMNDADIPHRTKVRELIIKTWAIWFDKLKAELAVCIFISRKHSLNP